jgi:hypothetical protein
VFAYRDIRCLLTRDIRRIRLTRDIRRLLTRAILGELGLLDYFGLLGL